jgi:hypothetical protein
MKKLLIVWDRPIASLLVLSGLMLLMAFSWGALDVYLRQAACDCSVDQGLSAVELGYNDLRRKLVWLLRLDYAKEFYIMYIYITVAFFLSMLTYFVYLRAAWVVIVKYVVNATMPGSYKLLCYLAFPFVFYVVQGFYRESVAMSYNHYFYYSADGDFLTGPIDSLARVMANADSLEEAKYYFMSDKDEIRNFHLGTITMNDTNNAIMQKLGMDATAEEKRVFFQELLRSGKQIKFVYPN